jgi:hypothetical protein
MGEPEPERRLQTKQKLRRTQGAGIWPEAVPRTEGQIRMMTFLDAPLQVSSEQTKTMINRKNRLPMGNARGIELVTGHPRYRLPWGQDRLVPIVLATLAIRQKSPRLTFESAAQMLDTFAMQQGGTQYRRLVGAFQQIFGATIFFGTDSPREPAAVVRQRSPPISAFRLQGRRVDSDTRPSSAYGRTKIRGRSSGKPET